MNRLDSVYLERLHILTPQKKDTIQRTELK